MVPFPSPQKPATTKFFSASCLSHPINQQDLHILFLSSVSFLPSLKLPWYKIPSFFCLDYCSSQPFASCFTPFHLKVSPPTRIIYNGQPKSVPLHLKNFTSSSTLVLVGSSQTVLWYFRFHFILVAQMVKESACNPGDPDLTPGLGRSAGERNGFSLQYFCLKYPMNRGAWQGTVHGVTELDTTEQITLHSIRCR